YLVATSAGEVGIDLNADHLVCDLTPLDSMIQRLGRVNRRGEGEARVDVVAALDAKNESAFEYARRATLDLLKRLPRQDDAYDASPRALRELSRSPDAASAFSPKPRELELTDVHLD